MIINGAAQRATETVVTPNPTVRRIQPDQDLGGGGGGHPSHLGWGFRCWVVKKDDTCSGQQVEVRKVGRRRLSQNDLRY